MLQSWNLPIVEKLVLMFFVKCLDFGLAQVFFFAFDSNEVVLDEDVPDMFKGIGSKGQVRFEDG